MHRQRRRDVDTRAGRRTSPAAARRLSLVAVLLQPCVGRRLDGRTTDGRQQSTERHSRHDAQSRFSASPTRPSPTDRLGTHTSRAYTTLCQNIRISTDILWRVFQTEPVPYTFVSVNRRNNEARDHIATWASASLFRRFTDTDVHGIGSLKTCMENSPSVDIWICIQCSIGYRSTNNDDQTL